jgi:hypothetical protein
LQKFTKLIAMKNLFIDAPNVIHIPLDYVFVAIVTAIVVIYLNRLMSIQYINIQPQYPHHYEGNFRLRPSIIVALLIALLSFAKMESCSSGDPEPNRNYNNPPIEIKEAPSREPNPVENERGFVYQGSPETQDFSTSPPTPEKAPQEQRVDDDQSSKGSYYIQVNAFKNVENAHKYINKNEGAFTYVLNEENGWHKVRVVFYSLEKAEAAAEQLEHELGLKNLKVMEMPF